jgi:DNA (cytosine-5)-methyltransferase 1
MRYRKKIFSLGELFCGPGGLALGAMNAHSSDGKYHIRHKWANDFDLDTCKTYINNICPDHPKTVHCKDVRDLNIAKLGKIDAFAYGFPCNSFSQVGEHDGLDDKQYGPLYWYGVEVLRQYKPKWFLAENVSGIKSAGDGQHFQKILRDLAESGYVLTTNLYKFEQYGVPQMRHRIIIVGIREDLDEQGFKFKVPSPEPYKNCDVSAKSALKDIPKDAPNNEMRRMSPTVVKRLSYIKPGQNAWTSDLPENLRIKTKTKISQIYRKLDPAKPSYTVTAAGGGGTYMYHWEKNRELTNRERARIQTFPDYFEFVGNYSSVRKQIGMAVPPRGAEIIFNAILDCFADIDYPSIEPSMNE